MYNTNKALFSHLLQNHHPALLRVCALRKVRVARPIAGDPVVDVNIQPLSTFVELDRVNSTTPARVGSGRKIGEGRLSS